MSVFGRLKGVRGGSKTWIPFSTSPKNQGFKVFHFQDIPRGVFEAIWPAGKCLGRALGEAFGCPLAILTGGRNQKLWFSLLRLSCFQLFNAKKAFFDVFGGKFGSILITLTGGSRYICELSAGVSIT